MKYWLLGVVMLVYGTGAYGYKPPRHPNKLERWPSFQSTRTEKSDEDSKDMSDEGQELLSIGDFSSEPTSLGSEWPESGEGKSGVRFFQHGFFCQSWKFGVLMFVDMRGYTSLCNEYKFYYVHDHVTEQKHVIETKFFIAFYQKIIADLAKKYGGVVINTMGDGAFIFFPGDQKKPASELCSGAVTCAAEIIQRVEMLHVYPEGGKKRTPVTCGVGIHVGTFDSLYDENGNKIVDFGSDVNETSRIEDMAKYRWPFRDGEKWLPILVSDKFYNYLCKKQKKAFRRHMDVNLRGFVSVSVLHGCERVWLDYLNGGNIPIFECTDKKPPVPRFAKKKKKKKTEQNYNQDDSTKVDDFKLPPLVIGKRIWPE